MHELDKTGLEAARRYQVPAPSKIDGWQEIPLWLIDGGAIPYPKNRWTLRDGTVVRPGQWIVDGPFGLQLGEDRP